MEKTKGICLSFVKFKETSIITQIFTEEFGRNAYIVHGVRSKNAKKVKIALFQPLTQLDLVVWHKENREVQRITESKLSYGYTSLNRNPRKTIVSIFISEVLGKVLKQQEKDELLFQYITEALQAYDTLQQEYENFHLQFLLKLPNYFGFGIHSGFELVENLPDLHFSRQSVEQKTTSLLSAPFDTHCTLTLSERREILQLILRFYQYHFENFGELKSLEVLRSIQ